MKFTLVLAAAGLAAAQTIADLPPCAAECIGAATLKVGCKLEDGPACSCPKQADIATNAVPCLLEKCSPVPGALAKAQEVGEAICVNYAKTAGQSTPAATTTAATMTSAGPVTTTAVTTTMATTKAANSTTAAPSSSVTAVVTAGAAAGPVVGFAAAVLGLAAYVL